MIRSPYIPNHSLLEVKVNSANVDFLVKVEFFEFLLSSGNGVVEEVELLKLGGTEVNSSDVHRAGSVNGVESRLGSFLHVVPEVELLEGGVGWVGDSVVWVNEVEVVELGGAEVNSSDVHGSRSVNGVESTLGTLLHVVPKVELLEVAHGLVAHGWGSHD